MNKAILIGLCLLAIAITTAPGASADPPTPTTLDAWFSSCVTLHPGSVPPVFVDPAECLP